MWISAEYYKILFTADTCASRRLGELGSLEPVTDEWLPLIDRPSIVDRVQYGQTTSRRESGRIKHTQTGSIQQAKSYTHIKIKREQQAVATSSPPHRPNAARTRILTGINKKNIAKSQCETTALVNTEALLAALEEADDGLSVGPRQSGLCVAG